MRPHKLMVVDDSMVFRNRIARLAADPRLPRVQLVAMAENGEEAIAQARHHRPDLVTMDLTMPRMDGPACLEVLREQLPEARILVVSALSDRATALKALA
ncbi:MAG: response regulator transcription factor, partial [Giesbergeria sp.]